MKNIEYIRENVPERELLEQLAEESAEKLISKICYENIKKAIGE